MLPIGLRFLPVPRLFWSAYTDVPFQTCIDCKRDLSESSVYIVQKRIVAGETVFELAICESCRCRLTETYSEETRAALTSRMTEYFRLRNVRPSTLSVEKNSDNGDASPNQVADPDGGLAMPQQDSQELLDRCMNFCLICDRPRELCRRYSLAGLCQQTEIVIQTSLIGQSPVMVCDDCEASLAGLISQKTRESWDRFVDEHFDGPPAIDIEDPSYSPVAF